MGAPSSTQSPVRWSKSEVHACTTGEPWHPVPPPRPFSRPVARSRGSRQPFVGRARSFGSRTVLWVAHGPLGRARSFGWRTALWVAHGPYVGEAPLGCRRQGPSHPEQGLRPALPVAARRSLVHLWIKGSSAWLFGGREPLIGGCAIDRARRPSNDRPAPTAGPRRGAARPGGLFVVAERGRCRRRARPGDGPGTTGGGRPGGRSAPYAAHLRAAGVPVTSVRDNGTIHDFVMLHTLKDTRAAVAATTQGVEFFRTALGEK